MRKSIVQSTESVILAALLCVVVLPVGAADNEKVESPANEYRIGVEDILDIAVWNNSELQKTVPVRPDGKISLPLINDIVAAGLTPMELRSAVTQKIAAYVQNPDVSVVVREIRSSKVSVIGNVRRPGRYDLRGPFTVLDALALAEGVNEFGARRKITILRRDGDMEQRIRFDYNAAVSKGQNNIFLKPGDIIVVP